MIDVMHARAGTAAALVVVAGPQAAGKSTLSAALGSALRARGEVVALVELDGIAAMALPSLPSWDVAHAIFESVVGQWARAGAAVVIAEGSGYRDQVERVRAQAPHGAAVLVVAVTTTFPVAFARAQEDRSRGVSREHAFLRDRYEQWATELTGMDPDVLIDSGTLSVEQAVGLVVEALDRARGSHRSGS